MATAPSYPVDPNQKSAYAQGGGMSFPVQPGYPIAQPGYPAQAGYPAQPPPYSQGYPAAGYPAAQPAPPPGYAPAGYAPTPGQPGMAMPNAQFGFRPPMDPSAYNASGGGAAYQPGGAVRDPKDNEEELANTGLGGSFGDKAIRHAFVRKVYLILMLQLLCTLGVIALFTFHDGVRMFVRNNIWVYFLSFAVFLVTYISLVCCSSVRRKYPGNVIMLCVFTLAMSYMTGTISSMHDTRIVLMTVGITAVICFLISLFAMQTKFDFTGCGTYLFVAGMIMMLFGIIAIFTYSDIMQTLYSAGIALLFSMYLVYDTQMLIGGRKHELSPEEYIFAALTLYMDIIQIFMALLSLFGSNND